MKYKIFTPNGYVLFYDSAFKRFPGCYKYVQYNSKGEIYCEKIYDAIPYLIRISFVKTINTEICFSKTYDSIHVKTYFFDENFDLKDAAIMAI